MSINSFKKINLQHAITPNIKGVALVVSISYKGSKDKTLTVLHNTCEDRKNMEMFLFKCNYAVFSGEDICIKEFKDLCNKFAKFKYCKSCTRLVVAFSGHGDDGVMIFQNGGRFLINEMMNIFTQSTALCKMVRMFFIDICHGDKLNPGYCSRSATAFTKESSKQYHEFNTLLAYSTTRKYVNIDGPTGGKWTSNLLKKLEENPNEDLLGILIKVNKTLMCKKLSVRSDKGCEPHYQIGKHTSTLAEKVYFKREVQVREGLNPLLYKLASEVGLNARMEISYHSGLPEENTHLNLQSAITRYTVGVALLVSNIYGYYGCVKTINETHKDINKMKHFLLKCKYAVFSRQNLHASDFKTLCKKLAKFNYQRASTTCRRLVVAYFGHGNNDVLIFQDNTQVSVNEMVNIFKPANAKNSSLGEMVRMFFIDSCRGGRNDSGRYASRIATVATKDEREVYKEYPNDVNMLEVYSSTSQGAAREGFWTSHLLEELEDLNEDILGALIKANKVMIYKKNTGQYYQTSEHVSTLAERVYFKMEALVVILNERLDESEARMHCLAKRSNDLNVRSHQLEARSNQLEDSLNQLKDRSYGLEATSIYVEAKSIHSAARTLARSNQTLAREYQTLARLIYSEAGSNHPGAKLSQESISIFAKANQLMAKLDTLVTTSDHLQDKLNQLEKKINQSEDTTYHLQLEVEQLWDRLQRWERLSVTKEYIHEAVKGGCRQGGTQSVGSVATGTTMNNEMKREVVTATAMEAVKQATKQAPKVAASLGPVIEVAHYAYEIKKAHNKKKRGEITETEYHDICVEQTATLGGSVAGRIAGSAGGAAIGAAVGSVVPGLGTVIGGVVGKFVGSIAGGLGGRLAGKGIAKKINYARHNS